MLLSSPEQVTARPLALEVRCVGPVGDRLVFFPVK